MNEKKRKFNLFKFIKGLFYFMCIITMFASLMRKAKAESADYTSEFWADVQEEMTNIYTGSNTVSGMQTALSNFAGNSYPTTVSHYIKFPEKNGTGVCYLASPYENALFVNSHGIDSSNDSTGGYINFTSYWAYFGRATTTYTDSTQYIFMIYIRSDRCGIFRSYNKGTSAVSAWYPYSPYNEGTLTQFYYGGDAELSKLYGDTLRDVGDGRFWFTYEGYVSKGENNYWGDYSGRLVYFPPDPEYSSDNRFKIGTYKTAFGTSILGINLDDYIEHYGQYESSYLHNLVLTLEYTQGLTVTQQTYVFNNESPEYHYVNSTGQMALSIPYYTFDGYDTETDTFPDYDNVKIVKADLSIGFTLQLDRTGVYDYYVTLNYSLYVGHSYDTNVPQVVTPQTIVFNQVIDGNDWSVSSGIVRQGSTPVIPTWSNNCKILVDNINLSPDEPTDVTFSYYVTFYDLQNNRDIFYDYDSNLVKINSMNLYDFDTLSTYLASYYMDKSPNFYDTIYISLGYTDSNTHWVNQREYIFYTSNYWIRQSIYGLSNIQYAVQSCGYYTSSLYDFMTSVMGTLNNNMVSYFTSSTSNQNSIIGKLSGIGLTLDGFNSSFESYSSSMVGYASSILSAINGLTFPTVPNPIDYSDILDTISGQIDDVIEAINNLEFDVGDIDLSVNWTDMTVALGGDLVYLFMPTYNNIDDRFEDYLDSIGILAVPFNFVSGIYDTMADEGWSENMEITVPQIKVMGHTLLERTDYSINPYIYFNYIGEDADVRDEKINTGMFQMIIMYIAILGASWFTYCHIFRRESEINEE